MTPDVLRSFDLGRSCFRASVTLRGLVARRRSGEAWCLALLAGGRFLGGYQTQRGETCGSSDLAGRGWMQAQREDGS